MCASVYIGSSCPYWLYLSCTQRAHGAMITSLWRQNDAVTSFWRRNDIIASCVRRVVTNNRKHHPGVVPWTRSTQFCYALSLSNIIVLNSGRFMSLLWRHNGRNSVSNHQPHDCLLNRLFRRKSKQTSKLRVTGLCAGNSPGTGEFPAQMASNAENVSIWWRHRVNTHTPRMLWCHCLLPGSLHVLGACILVLFIEVYLLWIWYKWSV